MLKDNAIDAIQVGIEDYETKDAKRLKSSIRNITAGLELVFKYKLMTLSPEYDSELFIKEKINPKLTDTGEIQYCSDSKNTIGGYALYERLKDFNIDINDKDFKKIRDLRNNVEHYYPNCSISIIEETIVCAIHLLDDFIRKYFSTTPDKFLGSELWLKMLTVETIYNEELERCLNTFNNVLWKYEEAKNILDSFQCTNCYSSLIAVIDPGKAQTFPDIQLTCKECNAKFNLSDELASIIQKHYEVECYDASVNGYQQPYENCPCCLEDTFINKDGCCFLCEYELECKDCKSCGSELEISDYDNNGFCSYCLYIINKDD